MDVADAVTPNGLSPQDAPTPDQLGSEINSRGVSEEDGDLFGSDEDEDVQPNK
jgi:hypothetical protein